MTGEMRRVSVLHCGAAWLAIAWGVAGLAACGSDGHSKAATDDTEARACHDDDDCAEGRCDPFFGCVECYFDQDCSENSRCVASSCHPAVACTTDHDCTTGTCDPNVERCIECTTDTECGDAQLCTQQVCVSYLPCTADADCDAGLRCDAALGCVACLTEGDCSLDSTCSSGRCLPRCESNADCPDVYHCEKSTCVRDVCERGATACTPAGNGVQRCAAEGDAFDLNLCESGETCIDHEGDASCEKRRCSPGRWACTDANEAELCSADGTAVVTSIDCTSDGKACHDGECVPALCEPGVTRCVAGGMATCLDAGTEEVIEPCSQGHFCDLNGNTCKPARCEPREVGCLAETVVACNADGSSFESTGVDCADIGQACWGGECRPIACAGDRQCVGGDSYTCTENRTRLFLETQCTFENGQFCDADSGQCRPFVCEPGLPACNGNLATSCAEDGSHPLDFGIDCAASHKVCWRAECLSPICEDGSFGCDDAVLKRCVDKGTAFKTVKQCGEGTICDADAGTCRVQKCVPDQPTCDGSNARTCDSSGLGYTDDSVDCSANGKVCEAGVCAPLICEPNARYCEGNDVRRCSAHGGSSQVLQECWESEYCDAVSGACIPDGCAAGEPVCAGNVASTCKADGSAAQPGGTDCAEQVCHHGACQALVCVPNARSCEAGNVALCNSLGTSFAPYATCRPREFCDAITTATAMCAADICPQGASACLGERLAHCNGSGSAISAPGVDCAETAQVCDLSGSCLPVASDFAGERDSETPFAGSAIHFNLFRVATPRKLVELWAAIRATTGPVTWIVYRSDEAVGTFSRINQTSTPLVESNGFISSGTVAPTLDVAGYYLIGLAVIGAHDIALREGSAPSPISFGSWLGGFSYTAGLIPTIPAEVEVGPGLVGDDVALRIRSALPQVR